MAKVFDSQDHMTDEWLTDNSPEKDNDGQLVFYTGLYEHSDGTIHDEPEGGWAPTSIDYLVKGGQTKI